MFEVEGLITVSPKTLDVGDTLKIKLKDWPNHNITTANAYLSIGGVDHTDIFRNAPISISKHRAKFEVDVKKGVPLGFQQVEFGSCSERFSATGRCPGDSEIDHTPVVISGSAIVVKP